LLATSDKFTLMATNSSLENGLFYRAITLP
jgi:hypothetical protein